MKRITRSAIVGHSARQLYDLVQDIEAYPAFLPWCLATVVHERSESRTRATLTLGIGAVRQALTTENQNRPPEAIDLSLVEGPFRQFSAAWRFHPLSAAACRIDFTLEYDFASRALARVLEPLFSRIADTMVDAFARRADQICGRAEAK